MIAKRKKMLSDLAKGELRAGLTALSGEFVELLVGRLSDSDRTLEHERWIRTRLSAWREACSGRFDARLFGENSGPLRHGAEW